MTLFLLAYLGGILTILSPCILPVLPFVFSRAAGPFLKNSLPMLAGMALMFAGVATLAAVSGGWAVSANQYGRIAALVLLAFFGVTLLSRTLADRLTRPLVALGDKLTQNSGEHSGVFSSFILGIATGLLWAPCAGPILGIVLTGAAIKGASASTTLLLLAYAAGAATSLAAALLIGGRLFAAMKQSLGAGEWVRRALGAAVLIGVAAIALGLDTGLLTKLSLANTSRIEQALIDKLRPGPTTQTTAVAGSNLPVEGSMPELKGAVAWLNSPPLTRAALKGKVVLVDFWTYSCINCLRSLPYVRAWAAKYKDHGLVVIGVHAPEFAFERDLANVQNAVKTLHVTYPVAVDSNLAVWQAFNNEYWPAHYFIDAQGRIRGHHFGEGDYDASERVIQQLLAEAGDRNVPGGIVNPDAAVGDQAAADNSDMRSPETYIGYQLAKNFASGPVKQDDAKRYSVPYPLAVNQWGLAGDWIMGSERAIAAAPGSAITFRFHARDLHLVLGSGDGKPVHFQVMIDGRAPGAAHGVDTDSDGKGQVTGQRLYQLVRQPGEVADHTFTIRFLESGVEAYSFTFG